ncbi:MAG: acyl-CoA dehydrogenase C-terminal domain-containing protein, partial [Thermodesulfobacteriota bacterium]
FLGEPQEIVRQSFTSPPPSLAQACPRLDPTPELERCVAKALAKESDEAKSYAGKVDSMKFYVTQILPNVQARAASAKSEDRTILDAVL